MSDYTAHVNANTGATASTPAEAWRSIPNHEGIPPSAARDARVAELIARAVQAQISQDLNARGDSASGSRARGSRARGQGRGNGRGGRPGRTRRRGGSGYYPAREAERTYRRGGSGYYPAREAERIARDRRGGHDAINGRGAVNGVPSHQAPQCARRQSWTAVVGTTSDWSGRNVW
ncbi:hypothetical protein N7519_001496 [Penicillium mononematosum]|uniref:uncharacterized protein n=1 Tax=Penicillium mononematosum TaxID=268346 RepID=UPI0025494854|nr:uncharacterized protein N7519_001496 [Penicillium mononematosum]KAJ6191475.1 hypothetical protein N7519_001496 [Penicillium mononematosum]